MNMIYSFSVGPTSVKIREDGIEKTLTAGRPVNVQCEVVGARPQPTIIWILGMSRAKIRQKGIEVIFILTHIFIIF